MSDDEYMKHGALRTSVGTAKRRVFSVTITTIKFEYYY